MALYRNIVFWDYSIETGEYVSWIRNPFSEYVQDPIFKVLAIYDDYTVDLEVVESDYLEIGQVFDRYPRNGLRRVKLGTIDTTDLTYKNHH